MADISKWINKNRTISNNGEEHPDAKYYKKKNLLIQMLNIIKRKNLLIQMLNITNKKWLIKNLI